MADLDAGDLAASFKEDLERFQQEDFVQVHPLGTGTWNPSWRRGGGICASDDWSQQPACQGTPGSESIRGMLSCCFLASQLPQPAG